MNNNFIEELDTVSADDVTDDNHDDYYEEYDYYEEED